jgi:hypothetical protein
VKSAYKLAARSKNASEFQVGSSAAGVEGRPIYKEIWSAEVPPKVRIFAWKLVTDGLATQDKRKRRDLVPSDICDVCGKRGTMRW